MTKKKPSPPAGIGTAGGKIWTDVVALYDLRPDELATLEDVCQLTDMIDALYAAWVEDGKPLTTRGSMGQQVTHPMISEIRTHRMARNALWRQLKLPDLGDAAGDGSGESNQQRAAAQTRWAAAHGKGA